MKKTVLILAVALLSNVVFYSCKPNDEKLQKEVTTALVTSNTGITSEIKDGVATLKGVVASEEAKTRAEEAVKAVKDVKSINNQVLVVVPPAPVVVSADETLTSTISSAISAAGFTNVTVKVNNGEVTLSGEIAKADLSKVMKIANEANPSKVINQLKTK